MMLRWTWLVPPAIRPPGAPSMPSAPDPSSMLSAPPRSPRSISASKVMSVIPSFMSEAAVEATWPCRWASALNADPRLTRSARRCRSTAPSSRSPPSLVIWASRRSIEITDVPM